MASDSLPALLRWAHAAYVAETPNLEHAIGQHAPDGVPLMRYAARAFLALTDPRSPEDITRADDWLRIASRTDEDGFYRTPLRRAIALLPRKRRLVARCLVAQELRLDEVALLIGIDEEFANDVFYRTMTMLRDRYLDRPLTSVGWLERSDSQRQAEAIASQV